MDERKQRMIELLINTLNGKSLNDALPILTNWKLQLKQENITFTEEENQILTQIFLAELSPYQMQQYEFIKPFLKK